MMGHNHEAAHRFYRDGTQYVNTGTWTDVTSLDPGSPGRSSRAMYALLEYPPGVKPGQGHLPTVSLMIWRGKHRDFEQFEF